jgi:hypothetical protein
MSHRAEKQLRHMARKPARRGLEFHFDSIATLRRRNRELAAERAEVERQARHTAAEIADRIAENQQIIDALRRSAAN